VQVSGTGNTAQVQLAQNTAYRLFHRAAGYDNTAEASIDTAVAFSTVVTPVADRDLQGALLWPQTASHTTQAAKFSYNAPEGLVEYDNQTGATEYIPFLAGYRAFGNIVYSPALTFALRFLPRINATRDGFVFDPAASLILRMSEASDGSAILEADLSYTDGQKAYDRLIANALHVFLLHAQMSEVLSSSSVQQVASAVDQSSVLAKEATVDALGTPLQAASYTAPDNAGITAIKAKTDQLVFTGANLNAVAKVVEDKTGYSLTTAERAAIAVEVESAILDENDGQAILNAIVGAIGNSNVDEIALVAAIRVDIERAGGKLDLTATKAQATLINEGVKKASRTIPHRADV
jgi:hypothetical protein